MSICPVEFMTDESAARKIVADPRPVMIVDTCNLGNIIGLALSGKTKMAIDVLRCLQTGVVGKLFHLVVPEQVYAEFLRPGQFTDAAIREMEEPVRHWNFAVQTYTSICQIPDLWTSGKYYREIDIEEVKQMYDELVEISKQFLDRAIIVKESQRAREWAYQRLKNRKRPAKQGKESFGDCVICGTSLSFLEVLREMGFAELAYFVSANTSDFAFNGDLHPDLRSDFSRVKLSYCQTIPEAFGGIWNRHEKAMRGLKT